MNTANFNHMAEEQHNNDNNNNNNNTKRMTNSSNRKWSAHSPEEETQGSKLQPMQYRHKLGDNRPSSNFHGSCEIVTKLYSNVISRQKIQLNFEPNFKP